MKNSNNEAKNISKYIELGIELIVLIIVLIAPLDNVIKLYFSGALIVNILFTLAANFWSKKSKK